MAAEKCDIDRVRSVVAVWGCGPIRQFDVRSAFLLGAAKVIAINNQPERLHMAEATGAITLNDLKCRHAPRLWGKPHRLTKTVSASDWKLTSIGVLAIKPGATMRSPSIKAL